jgi:hypothetical protein
MLPLPNCHRWSRDVINWMELRTQMPAMTQQLSDMMVADALPYLIDLDLSAEVLPAVAIVYQTKTGETFKLILKLERA